MRGKKAIASKFPTARIKKIMQEDEEIGKVAQGTPIVISRALELLLKDMIVETADIARTSGSKKLQPWHVKRLVAQNRQYDFLDDLVQSIPDPTAGAEARPSGTNGNESKPNGRGKTRAAAASSTNSGKVSPASRPSAGPSSSAVPIADPGVARAPPAGMGPIVAPPQTVYGTGKGPSNASIILNSPIKATTEHALSGPILPIEGGSSVKPATVAEPDFDDYDDDDDDDDDDYDDYDA